MRIFAGVAGAYGNHQGTREASGNKKLREKSVIHITDIKRIAENFQILEFQNYTESVGVWRASKLITKLSESGGTKLSESGGPPNSS